MILISLRFGLSPKQRCHPGRTDDSEPGLLCCPYDLSEPYYEQYRHGTDISEIVHDILRLYRATPSPSALRADSLEHFSDLRSRIMFRMIHTASNQVLLKDVPHLPYLDLSIVFFISLERNESGQMTALIHHEHIRRWNVTVQDLWEAASHNTPLEYPRTDSEYDRSASGDCPEKHGRTL